MMKWQQKNSRLWLAGGLGAVLFLSLVLGYAQVPFSGKGKNLRFPEYDAQSRMKSLLTADEATAKGPQLWLIKGLQVQTYTYETKAKTTNMIVTADDCLYDQKNKKATSESRVTARAGDGKFMISGTGFKWDQGNGSLILSNKVRAIISKDMFEKTEGK